MNEHLLAIVGYVIMIIIVYVIAKLARKKRATYEFDERQIHERGIAYQHGFLTVVIGLCFEIILFGASPVIDKDLFANITYAILCLGLVTYAGYAIWHDAYLTVNTKRKSYLIITGAIGILNLGTAIIRLTSGDPIITSGLNFMLGIAFLAIFAIFILKDLIKKDEEDDSEES